MIHVKMVSNICSGQCYLHEGNYSSWLEAQQARLDLEEKKEAALQKQIKQELEWIRQTPKGRLAKNKVISLY